MNAELRDSMSYWGSIPEKWRFTPIKRGFNNIGSGTTPPTGREEYFDGTIPWVTTSELREKILLLPRRESPKKH